MDGFTMYVVVTMKMMSSTSVMSTSGVTLMSVIIRPESSSWNGLAVLAMLGAFAPVLGCFLARPRQDHVRDGVDASHGAADPSLEDVEGDDGGQRDHQADRGGDQRFRDAGHDHRRAAALIAR